jgi:ketopantoate reductase
MRLELTSLEHRYYQRIREELWQVSWVEETGTTVTICLDRELSELADDRRARGLEQGLSPC